jgi:type I restriction enzyme S subunit
MPKQAQTALVPKLRFPEFRGKEGWREESGEGLFDQINDRNPAPGLPVLAITQEHGAIPRHMIDYHVSVTEKSIESYKVVREGDFIISLRSFQGGIEYSLYHGICSPAYVILRRRGKGSDDYFRHYLKTERFIRILTKNLEGLRDGKMISYTQFAELLLPVPGSSEQQKIASCLSSVDELMAAQARKVDALKAHKKGLMQQLFPREGETQPRLRFPEFRKAGGWEVTVLSSVTQVVRGGSPRPIDGFLTRAADGLNWLKIGDVDKESKFVTRTAEKVRPEALAKTRVVRPGDLILSNSMSFGRPYILRITTCIHDGWIAITNIAARADRDFLFYWISAPASQSYFETNAAGSGVQNLNAEIINALPLSLPPLPEQRRIADCLSALDDLIAAETQKLDALKTHKKGLMQQLFPAPEEAGA